jgi:hypothetical protein
MTELSKRTVQLSCERTNISELARELELTVI